MKVQGSKLRPQEKEQESFHDDGDSSDKVAGVHGSAVRDVPERVSLLSQSVGYQTYKELKHQVQY